MEELYLYFLINLHGTELNYTVTDLLKTLLGNVSVNTFQHTYHVTVEVSSMWFVPRNSRRAVFSAWAVPRLHNGSVCSIEEYDSREE
jgi:hypothetical protein